MRILIAEDDLVSRRVLETTLLKWGYEVVVAADGEAAWAVLQGDDSPRLAVLDWMMPGVDGVELCRRVRALGRSEPTYLILLTAREKTDDVVAGLEAGADDYVIKPFDRQELQARVHVGERVAALQASLARRVRDLEDALAQVKQLQGMLPICCYCKKIRDDSNYWQQVEHYISSHSGARFSHGICPECFDSVVKRDLKDHFGKDLTG
jgi:DNA-binding response OmpR family regulator